MNNRISGDFDSETLESFRAMYSQREVKPEDLEVDGYTGLPTDVVTNISPWIQHTGLWKANPGTDRGFIPNQTLESEEEFDDTEISEEDFDRMVDEVLSDLEDEERFADEIYNAEDDDDDYEDEGESTDEEIESLIERILSEQDDEPEEEEVEEGIEVASEDEIEALLRDILGEIEEEELEEERVASSNREVSDDDLEDMIREFAADATDEPEAEAGTDVNVTEGEEEVLSDDDIDNLIDEILGETD